MLVKGRIKEREYLPDYCKCCDVMNNLADRLRSNILDIDISRVNKHSSAYCPSCKNPYPEIFSYFSPTFGGVIDINALDLDEGNGQS